MRQDGSVRSDSAQFSYLRGRNIFAVDLSAEARRISRSYPSYQQVRVVKFYPDRVFVDFVKRRPRACVRAARTWYLDEKQIVFELPGSPDVPAVPVVTGLERTVTSADSGRRLESARAAHALYLIQQVQSAKSLAGYTLTRVDAAGPSSLTVFLTLPAAAGQRAGTEPAPPQELKVKIGLEDIRHKLSVLATVLAQVRNTLYTIEYIDLRFKEPVIKFKERT